MWSSVHCSNLLKGLYSQRTDTVSVLQERLRQNAHPEEAKEILCEIQRATLITQVQRHGGELYL